MGWESGEMRGGNIPSRTPGPLGRGATPWWTSLESFGETACTARRRPIGVDGGLETRCPALRCPCGLSEAWVASEQYPSTRRAHWIERSDLETRWGGGVVPTRSNRWAMLFPARRCGDCFVSGKPPPYGVRFEMVGTHTRPVR